MSASSMPTLAPSAALCNMTTCLQQQVEWIDDCIRHLRASRARLHTKLETPFYTGRRYGLVELVGVRRSELWYCEGYWGYCDCMVEVVELVATGKMPDEVVRVREWPSWVSLYWPGGGRTAMPGRAVALLRRTTALARVVPWQSA